MPIKNLQSNRQAQFPVIGKLRKGSPQVEKNGKMVMGRDLGHFRFDSDDAEASKAFAAAYGNEPKSIRVYLPFPTVDQNFQAWMEEYNTGGLVRRCDGESQSFHRDERGNGVTVPTQCEKACGRSCLCKQVGRLYVVVPELVRLAYVVVETHSIYDIIQLTENLQAAFALRGNLAGVPFILSRREREISTPNSKEPGKRFRTKKSLLFIEPDPEWVQRKLLAMRADAFAMLPEVSGASTQSSASVSSGVNYETGEISVDGNYEDDESELDAFSDPNARATPASDRLKNKIDALFGDNAAKATTWLVRGYTLQNSKQNIRTTIAALSADECDTIADSLTRNGKAIVDMFAVELKAAQQASGK